MFRPFLRAIIRQDSTIHKTVSMYAAKFVVIFIYKLANLRFIKDLNIEM
jgi:hypothetical protein